MPERKSTAVRIKRISKPKPYEVLANQLREAILRGEIPEGDALPSERELVAQTGLTRGSVREALRVLAFEGLIQTRQGRWGGNIVTLPGNESMAHAVSQFVRGRRLSLQTLRETREAIEPALARLAAIHRSDDDIALLKSTHENLVVALDSFLEFSAVNIKWHNTVAAASGNELLSALLYSITHGIALAPTTSEYDAMDARNEVIKIHSRLNDAIEQGRPDEAECLMRNISVQPAPECGHRKL
jgi:GntR family transcriptional regulator, transcriptional repressor for pyruvate dehydrogenase complex